MGIELLLEGGLHSTYSRGPTFWRAPRGSGGSAESAVADYRGPKAEKVS